MPMIHVHTPFTLNKDDGTRKSFSVGDHDVDKDVVDHWYVKLHSGDKPTVGGRSGGGPDAGLKAMASAEQRQSVAAAREASVGVRGAQPPSAAAKSTK